MDDFWQGFIAIGVMLVAIITFMILVQFVLWRLI